MEILIFIIGVFLTARYLSLAGTKWYLFSLRDTICIERFRQKQKVCDVIIASYNTTVALTHLWSAIMLTAYLFDFNLSSTTILRTAVIVIVLLLLQIVCQHIIDKKYDLRHFYDAVVEMKRNEDVVGEDNDYEVNFIQSYNEIKSEMWWSLIWMVYILFISVYLLA